MNDKGEPEVAGFFDSLSAVSWYLRINRLLAKAHEARQARERTAQDVDSLSSAMLREAFWRGGGTVP